MSMASGPRQPVSIRRLFLLTIVLKISSSVAGWLMGSPWILGFTVPLVLMSLYILVGIYRGDDTVSDEKFADSCYYLGFIFTISSILVALFDIPSIAAKIEDISIRFGAAMVSTVFGLIVRVYLVNFRSDFQDAVRNAENGLLDAVRAFRIHLDLSVERLREFQTLVDDASRVAAARADTVIRDAAAEHARHFAALFDQLAAENRQVIEESATHIRAATQTLSNALYDYAETLVSGTGKFEAGIEEFSGKLDARLERIGFPEDYFAGRLNPSVARLGQSVAEAGDQVAALVSEFRSNARKISAALNGLSEKTAATSSAMDKVRNAVQGQAEALDLAGKQIAAFDRLAQAIEKMESVVAGSVASMGMMEQAVRRIEGIAGPNRDTGRPAERQTELAAAAGLAEWLPRLQEADARISGRLNEAIHAFDRSTLKMASAIGRQEAALTKVSEQLETLLDRLDGVSERGPGAGGRPAGSGAPVRRLGLDP
jgi:methyl-accepting chemotaxis protein